MTNPAPTKPCHFCGEGTRIEGNHWDGARYIRVPVCSTDYAAGKLAKAPRRPRQPKQIPATDWNMLVAFTEGRKRSR